MLLVWVSSKHKCFVRGTRTKHVACEACGGEYTYELGREAEGTDTSLFSWDDRSAFRKAEADAQKKLEKVLDDENDPVGCPACGRVQSHMIEAVRHRSYQGLRELAKAGFLFASVGIGLILVFGTAPFFVDAQIRAKADDLAFGMGAVGGILACLFGLPAAAFWALRNWLNSRYDPNRT